MLIFQESNSLGNYNYNSKIYEKCEWEHHFHKNYELIYVINGEFEVIADGKKYTMKQNEFSLILPNQIHHLHTPKTAKVWIGVFSADFVGSFDLFMQGKKNSRTTFFVDENLMPYLKRVLLTEVKSGLFALQGALMSVCSEYIKDASFYSESRENNLPMKIFKYIENNFREDISLKTMSTELGYDYNYMSRLYHSIFHVNFKKFVNQFRLGYAQKLMLENTRSIADIAHESGFGSIRTLNRSFLNEYGVPPIRHAKKNDQQETSEAAR